jgi:hypothetical protein
VRAVRQRLVPGIDLAVVAYPAEPPLTGFSRRRDELLALLERTQLLDPTS